MSAPQSETKSEPTKETSQNQTWIERLNLKTLSIIGVFILLFIVLYAKGDNFLCLLSSCSSNSYATGTTPLAGLLPVAGAGGIVFLMIGVFGMSILPALGLGAIAFFIFQFIHLP